MAQQLQNVLEKPLMGQEVMVPITTKAFFPGTLKPNTAGKHVHDDELVMVNLGRGYYVEMTRNEASRHLQNRKQQEQTTENNTSTVASKGTTRANTTRQPDLPTKSVESSKQSKGAPLPYFEIREEYDEKGQEIRAEAINVAKELEYLQKKRPQTTDPPVVPPPTASWKLTDGESSPRKQLGDEEYASLTKRLDQLAKLEEEAEQNQRINLTSAKKLQSKGWAKGFLSSKKKTRAKTVEKPKTKNSVVDSSTEEERDLSRKRVGFQQTNEVLEIPRIGQRSATELKPQQTKANRRQLNQEVFSGVVLERKTQPTVPSEGVPQRQKKLSKFAQERQQQRQQQQH